MTWQESGKKGTWARCGHSQCQGMDVSCISSVVEPAGEQVTGGVTWLYVVGLALWKVEPSGKPQISIKMWCKTVLPALMIWVLVTAVGTQCTSAGGPAGTVIPSPGCVEVLGFITNAPHQSGNYIHLLSKCDPTPIAVASPWYCLESFSPEVSEQMKFISMVTWKSYPRIQIFFFLISQTAT